MKRVLLSLFHLAFVLHQAAAADSVVVFNELQYHPATNEVANEWLELHNQMAIDIDLSAWAVRGGINCFFPEGTVIPAGGYLVVASDPAALRAASGAANVVGPFTGRLDNAGGRLELRDRNDRLMDRLEYRDGGKWPVAPDGSGVTLAKRHPDAPSESPGHWTSSVLVGGTPGGRNFPDDAPSPPRQLIGFDALWRFEASGTDLGTAWREPGFDDSAWGGHNSATLVSYWPFDGNANATRGVNGTLIGAVPATLDRHGVPGGALEFSGPSQYVSVAGGGGLNGASAGAISLWVKWNSTQDADCCGSFGAVLARQGNGLFSDNILALDSATPTGARVVWRQSGGPAPVLITGTTVVGTNWHHIAVTFAPGGSTLYVDGVAQGTAVGAGLNNNSSVPLSIGAWAGDGDGFAAASIDDVAIWDRPLSAAQVAQLAAQTKMPLDFPGPENAAYFAGDGRLTGNDELRHTALPLGPTTYYFRHTFESGENPAQVQLALDLAVDDGAALYLNGAEIYRHNMPDGAIGYATLAASAVDDAELLHGIVIPATDLRVGTNVLAVEVHQAAAEGDTDMVFAVALTASVSSLPPSAFEPGPLVFNEISAAGATPFEIELVNQGAQPLDVAGYVVARRGSSTDAESALPSQLLAAGELWVLSETTLGFGAVPGDKLFLFLPGKRGVADAVEVHERMRARSPDGGGEWLTPSAFTPGVSNLVTLEDAVVFNEIMYHAPPTIEETAASPPIPFSESPEQWVELFNRSRNTVNLSGWRLDEGIDFRFASNTAIPPGGYLVVAKDPPALLEKFPGIAVTGPFTNQLSHRGERLVLKDAADNPADVVPYFDGGRWPRAADARGSSLELRDPWADNSAGEAWAASDEMRRSTWRRYSYRGVLAASAVGPDTQWNEFVFGLLAEGVVLLDDIAVIETPATTPVNLIQHGTFDTGTNTWRIIGNHHGEVIDDPDQPGNKVLKLTATGATEHMSNHGETTFVGNRAPVNGREYLITFRARWVSGSRQFHTRLYFNRLARTTLLDAPTTHGTPGRPNTALTTNLGPTYASLRHEPPVPAPFTPVLVSVEATDPDGVAVMTLWWRPDGGAWQSVSMATDPAARNRFSGSLPGQSPGQVLQFYVEGLDALGAKSSFPVDGTNSRALVQFDDGLATTNGLHNVRLVTLTADAEGLFRTVNLMSNERIGCTLIYNERDCFYDCGLRLEGSEHSRTTTPRLGFNLSFDSEQMFRGIHRTVAIDRSESTGFGQREMLLHQTLNHAGGTTTKYHDLVQVLAPRPEYTGSAELQLARYTDVFLEDQFKDGADGTVFEYELVYQLNSTDTGTPEGNKVPAVDSFVGTTLRDLGADKEAYRWSLLIKNNEDRDDYSRMITFCQTMELSGTAFNRAVTNIIDVDAWLRGVAVNVLAGCGDSYGGDGAQHNVQFYVRPGDGKVIYFSHDMDAFFDVNRGIVPNDEVSKLIAVPAYARAYYSHLLDIIDTTYNTAYLARWANQFGRLLPAQPFASHLTFIQQRGAVVTSAVNAAVPNVAFAISNNGGNSFGTTHNTVSLMGTAPLSVSALQVNGVNHPITWTGVTSWTISVLLPNLTNLLVVQGLDHYGVALSNATASITVTNLGVLPPSPIVINEWMADNRGPAGLADPADGLFQDWFELFNPNPNPLDLSGFYLTDDPTRPTRWCIPTNVFISGGGFLLVWADNNTNQNLIPGGTNLDLHANFQLNSGGEFLGLFARDGVTPLSAVTFGPQLLNVSQGRYRDGDTNTLHFMTHWTPRAANQLGAPTPPELGTITLQAGGRVSFEVSVLANRAYRVDYTDDLGAPAWTPLSLHHATSAGTIIVTDYPADQAQRYYRATLLQ